MLNYSVRPKGMTLLEIMIAMVILAIALLPIFHMINKGTEDTDLTASQAFAVSKATEILNTMLDTVPFEALRAASPVGIMCTEDICTLPEYNKNSATATYKIGPEFARNITEMLFGDRAAYTTTFGSKAAYFCQGKVKDPRGIVYLVSLGIEDVIDAPFTSTWATDTIDPDGKFEAVNMFTMSFMVNPNLLNKADWVASYQNDTVGSQYRGPRFEVELDPANDPNVGKAGIAGPAKDVYAETDFAKTKRRYAQATVCDPVRYTTGVPYCSMKRLVCEVQWNMDRSKFSDPDPTDRTRASIQRIHLITFKGDIAR